MYMPIELSNLINEYAKPITRPDWRKGCYTNRLFRLDENNHIILYDFGYFIYFQHYLMTR